jgi:predicted membrane protein
MGGLEIDLHNASIKGEAVIDIFAMMGGVEMRVPEDWLVVIEGFPFMGGYENKTHAPKDTTKRLVIKGTAVMGGVEIKN